MKSTFFALSLFFAFTSLFSQVDSSEFLDENKKETSDDPVSYEDDSKSAKNKLISKENLIYGLEFMPYLNSNFIGLEAAPFVGLNFNDIFWLGIGATGAITLPNSNGARQNAAYGPHSFARLNILQSYFLQVEYRAMNVEYESGIFVYKRKWVQSPIIGFGYQYGDKFWLNIGYAVNNEFKNTNPLGALTYRLGIRIK